MTEAWLPIAGYPKYAVSNHGRMKRTLPSPHHPAGRILDGSIDDNGRPKIALCNYSGRARKFQISRLVALALAIITLT